MTLKYYDYASQIFAYEAGELDGEGIRALFQYLVDSGTIYHLQGFYGRMAETLIRAGEIQPSEYFNP